MATQSIDEFSKVCTLDDLWPGEMEVFEVQGVKLLLCHTEDGTVKAVQLICPHQSFALSEGELIGEKLICTKHMWEFDVKSGCGINPTGTSLALYPVKVVGEDVMVSVAGIEPKYARP
jgi:toluene monooxygenase system ferredoxin subunit